MLPRAHRVTDGADFRAAVRRGRRTATGLAVYHVLPTPGPARYGVITARAVGGAVERNRLRRRFRAVARELVDEGATGADVVVRMLPAATTATWPELRSDIRDALSRDPVPA